MVQKEEIVIKLENIEYQRGGTYVVMEGPQFSTLAESNLYRSWKADVIGMTNMPEAKLAREAEIRYSTVAMVTSLSPGRNSLLLEILTPMAARLSSR